MVDGAAEIWEPGGKAGKTSKSEVFLGPIGNLQWHNNVDAEVLEGVSVRPL